MNWHKLSSVGSIIKVTCDRKLILLVTSEFFLEIKQENWEVGLVFLLHFIYNT